MRCTNLGVIFEKASMLVGNWWGFVYSNIVKSKKYNKYRINVEKMKFCYDNNILSK
jgi:hypothetical protein